MLTRSWQRASAIALLSAAAVLSLGPIYIMLMGSFKTQSEFLNQPLALPDAFRLDAYRVALESGFRSAILSSIILTVGSAVVSVVFGSLAAWGLVRSTLKAKDTAVAGIAALMVVPPVVLVVPLFLLSVSLDLISSRSFIIFVYTGLMLPFSIFMMSAYFRTIPVSLLEAAEVDGASELMIFRKIVVPLSAAPLATLLVLNAFWAWNELLIVLVLIQDRDLQTLMVNITGFQSRFSLDIPVVMAGLTIAVAPAVMLYLISQRFFISGLQGGAVKGE